MRLGGIDDAGKGREGGEWKKIRRNGALSKGKKIRFNVKVESGWDEGELIDKGGTDKRG